MLIPQARRLAKKFAVVAVTLVIAITAFLLVRPLVESARQKEKIEALQTRCVQAMIAQTCTVTNGGNDADTSTSVFVAGTGRIDLEVYKELKAFGTEMCTHVSKSCEASWDGTTCRVARALYP